MMNFEEQKARILQGLMYNDKTAELMEARRAAVVLTNEYNSNYGKDPSVCEEILKKLFKRVGRNVFFERGCNFF